MPCNRLHATDGSAHSTVAILVNAAVHEQFALLTTSRGIRKGKRVIFTFPIVSHFDIRIPFYYQAASSCKTSISPLLRICATSTGQPER